MWAVLNRFCHEKLPDELNAYKVHRLENVTVMSALHSLPFLPSNHLTVASSLWLPEPWWSLVRAGTGQSMMVAMKKAGHRISSHSRKSPPRLASRLDVSHPFICYTFFAMSVMCHSSPFASHTIIHSCLSESVL